jgi:hypothetical protein
MADCGGQHEGNKGYDISALSGAPTTKTSPPPQFRIPILATHTLARMTTHTTSLSMRVHDMHTVASQNLLCGALRTQKGKLHHPACTRRRPGLPMVRTPHCRHIRGAGQWNCAPGGAICAGVCMGTHWGGYHVCECCLMMTCSVCLNEATTAHPHCMPMRASSHKIHMGLWQP